MSKEKTLKEIKKYLSEIAGSKDAMSYRNQAKMAFLTAMYQEIAGEKQQSIFMGKFQFLRQDNSFIQIE